MNIEGCIAEPPRDQTVELSVDHDAEKLLAARLQLLESLLKGRNPF
jgi:hypothetical protein